MAFRIILSIVFLLNIGCTPLVGALLKKQQDASTDTPAEGTPYCENTPQCPGGNYCRIEPCGAMVGFCTKIPPLCESDFVPVCGCDGVTYDNFCKLTMAQKARDHDGPCNTAVCGLDNLDACGEGYFCDGPCDWTQNRCVLIADVCGTAEPTEMEVCGCDLVTYTSDCNRILNGQRLDHAGRCDVSSCYEGDMVTCGEGSFCEGPSGMCYTGTPGWCQPLLPSCDFIYDPVCGCDDVTYDNDCMRQAAGVWQKHWGPCTVSRICELDPSSGDTRGTCDPGFFCELPPGACNRLISPYSTELGVCVQDWNCEEPLLPCREADTPVCGCDGITTYEDDCARRGAGVNVGCCGACGDLGCLLDEV